MRQKGITLIALVLTIVLLIILGSVTVSIVLKDGGLADQAKWAAEQSKESAKSEQEQLDDVASKINDIIAGIGSGGSDTNSTGGEDTNQVGDTNTVDTNSVDTNSVDTNSVEETNTVDTNTIEPEPEPLPDGTITIGDPQWQEDGTASITVSTTEPDVTIEYQIGGTDEGSWTEVEGGTITGIENGETVYVRITDGDQASNPQEITVKDETNPTVTVSPQGTATTNSISVSVSAEDKETGMADSVTYTYYIKESSQPDESYAAPENAQGITQNTYTFTGLKAGVSYDIKVEVNGDKAGNVGTGTLAGQTTGTIPGGDTGLEQGAITFDTTWENESATVTISTNTDLQIEYQKNTTDDDGWEEIENNGQVTGLKHGDTVFARLTDGTNYGDHASANVIDDEAPAKANIQITPETLTLIAGESLTATVTHTDNKSGVDMSSSKWAMTTSATEIGTSSDVISQYTGSFTTNGAPVTLDSSNTGTYYLHVLTVDKAGNKTETVSNAITINGITGQVSQNGNVTWKDGKASITLSKTSADDQFEIEYKINDGNWTKYDGAITGLNHGDTVTARLTNDTTTGPEAQFPIQDTTDPVVTVNPGGTTSSSVTVSVNAVDNESGMIGNPTYTYQIKQSSQGDENYQTPSDASNISSNSYTFKNLTQGTSYDVRVIVNGDVAGRTGTGTLPNQQTGTIPGGDEGVEQGAITFGTVNWQNGVASVTIATDTGMQLQYQKNATEENGWTNIDNNGTVPDLNHGDTVFARLTDGTNFGDFASTNILDNDVPEKATIEPSATSLLIGETLTATVTHSDVKSGVDINASGWVMNTNASAMGTDNTGAYTGKFTANPETITLNSNAAGTYYLHVLTIDVAGNKTETVSEAITINAITGTVSQSGQVSWSAGQATLVLQSSETAESQLKIVYKINGEGEWQDYNGTSITGLSHGDTVTACLTNNGETTFGPEASFEIKDETDPTVTVTAQGSPTTNSITVTAQASDNESGMKDSPTYTFQYRQSGSGSYTTPDDASNISNAQYTFAGLTQGTSYDIQVIVNGDNAGNTGTGTLLNQTTATVPGADAGLQTGSITASPATWSNYKASTTLATTTNFKIQYQVNGTAEGSWSEAADSPVTVSNLNHGDTVYARLTDGTNAGNYAAINILDGTAPTVSVEVGEVTYNSIAVTVNATDNESGLADSNAYRYYLNDEQTPRATSSSNTYTYENLTGSTDYTIKVEVVDKGNNPGTGTAQATTPEEPEIFSDIYSETTEYIDSEGNKAWIPGGFAVGTTNSINKINNGLVITDRIDENHESTGNEFVWIPVPDYTTMYTEASATLNGVETTTSVYSKLRLRSGDSYTVTLPGQKSGIREPDLIVSTTGTNYDASPQYYQDILGYASPQEMAEAMVSEYEATYNSIKQYKGFYIGRYELTGTAEAPTVKKGQTVQSGHWYDFKKACSNIVKSNYAQSEMIYGNQWDEVMSWLKQTVFRGQESKVDSDSSSWGNYNNSTGDATEGSGELRQSGYSKYWKANNIYDLAGNYYEWTQEAYFNDGRSVRGGAWFESATNFPVSKRWNDRAANVDNPNWSSRAALYIKVPLPEVSDTETQVANYADVDGNGSVDGVIYADLAIGGSGTTWGDSYGQYTIPKGSNFKKYEVTQESYSGSFGTGKVIAPVSGSSGNERFYVMALTDVDGKQNGTHYCCWYDDAYGNMSDYSSQTSTNFGTGEQNTINMIAKWNESLYGAQNDGSYDDMWGISAVNSRTWNGSSGWYIPSRGEWAAFADQLGIDQR